MDQDQNRITLFAETNYRNQRRRFGIKTDDRRRHIYIIGKTGMGKTVLQENMIVSDIMAGNGVCYIDPHGDTAEKILDYIPPHRINDVVYFNPADLDYPVGFNILETITDDKKHLAANGLMSVFKKIWPDVWSARMEYILQNTVLALLDYPGATLLGINRLLVDADYRKKVIAQIKDPVVKTFWVGEFASWSEKYATEAIAPIQNKVGQFLSASVIRNIVAQVKSTIDIRDIMDNKKIFIVNLSKGRIGDENMRLLGGMIISRIQMAAMERVEIPEDERKDFFLFVDEFQNFANESFASILSEARKYRLSLTIAHQYMEQLTDETRAAVIGNVGTIIAFRVGSTDAEILEKEFAPVFTAEDLVSLPKYNIYLKLMIDGVATSPFSAGTLPPVAIDYNSSEKVIKVSRERYAVSRDLIAEKVLRWAGMKRNDDDSVISTNSLKSVDDGDENIKEYLQIDEERFKMPKPKTSKKEKPKFEHVCSRCGKIWYMPIQLDKTRPMYCADCMPIIKEEQKMKNKIKKTVDFIDSTKKDKKPKRKKNKQNHPRIVGNLDLVKLKQEKSENKNEIHQEDQDEKVKENNASQLLSELAKKKGAQIETKKTVIKKSITDQTNKNQVVKKNKVKVENLDDVDGNNPVDNSQKVKKALDNDNSSTLTVFKTADNSNLNSLPPNKKIQF